MGTIVERRRADGTSAYRAQILIKSKGQIVHQESSTFSRRTTAEAWLKRREKELKSPGGLEAAQRKVGTVGDIIKDYIREKEGGMGRTKTQVLRSICESHMISDIPTPDLQPKHIVDFARGLHRGGRSPSTVQNYLSHLSAALSMGRTAWGYDLDRNVVADGVAAARHLDLAGKSNSRDRRPTLLEIDALMTHFADASARDRRTLPMHRIMAYAIFSVRRQDEITRITWEDFDEAQMRQMVRDMKHPGQKKGNDVLCEVTPEALRIMQLQPGRSSAIFPYNSDTISARFTRACKFLEIDDLHFHDLRHEGISRLFEMGRTIPQVAAVSGHRSWQSLQRYSHLRMSGDKFAGWEWWDKLEAE